MNDPNELLLKAVLGLDKLNATLEKMYKIMEADSPTARDRKDLESFYGMFQKAGPVPEKPQLFRDSKGKFFTLDDTGKWVPVPTPPDIIPP
jgi:hypothetical protein